VEQSRRRKIRRVTDPSQVDRSRAALDAFARNVRDVVVTDSGIEGCCVLAAAVGTETLRALGYQQAEALGVCAALISKEGYGQLEAGETDFGKIRGFQQIGTLGNPWGGHAVIDFKGWLIDPTLGQGRNEDKGIRPPATLVTSQIDELRSCPPGQWSGDMVTHDLAVLYAKHPTYEFGDFTLWRDKARIENLAKIAAQRTQRDWQRLGITSITSPQGVEVPKIAIADFATSPPSLPQARQPRPSSPGFHL
jgi:hypothetical protein